MAEDLISSIIDTVAVERQVQTVISYLDTLKAQIKAIQIAQPGLNIANVNQLTTANNSLTQSIVGLNSASQAVVSSQQQLANIQAKVTQAVQASNQSLQENIATRIKVKNSIDSYLASQKEDLALLKSGVITRAEYNKRLVEGNVKIEQYKNQLLTLNKEIKNQTLTTIQQGGAYAQLNKQYLAAQTNARNLAAIYGIESKEAKVAAASALELNTKLQAIDKSVGLSQRNVGNYGSALTKAFSGLRLIANILPGIGIAGILSFAATPIINWISKISEATGSIKIFNRIFEDSGKIAGEQVAQLEILRASITNLNLPLKDRLLSVKEYNKLADDGNRIDEKQIDNLTEVNKQISAQIELIKARAIAKAFENQLSEAAEVLVSAQIKQKQQEAQINKSLANAEKEVLKARDGANFRDIANQRDAIKLQKQLNEEAVTLAQKKFDDLLKLANQFLEKGKPKQGAEGQDGQIADLIKRLSTEYNIYKRHQEQKIELFKEAIGDDHIYYSDKFKIIDAYVKASQELINADAAFQIQAAKEEAAREKANLEKDKAGKTPRQIVRIDQNIAIVEKNLADKIVDINDDKNVRLENLEHERVKTTTKILDDQLKKEKDFFKGQEVLYSQNYKDAKAYLAKKEKDEAEALKERKKLYDQFQTAIVNLANATESAIFELIDKSIQKQIDALTKKKDLIDQNAEKEINAVNMLGLSEADRIRRTAEIEKQAAFDKERINEKIKAAQIKQAKFQKVADAAAIVSGTALAVVNALKSAPPPANFALAAIVGALGAVQLAVALATPLPQFAKGTGNAPKGLAVVGEKGQELIQDRHGNISLSPGVPTLTYLQGGEKITPAHLTQDILNASAMRSIANMDQTKAITAHDINTALIKDQLQELRWLNRKTTNVSVNMPVENSMWHIKHFKQ